MFGHLIHGARTFMCFDLLNSVRTLYRFCVHSALMQLVHKRISEPDASKRLAGPTSIVHVSDRPTFPPTW